MFSRLFQVFSRLSHNLVFLYILFGNLILLRAASVYWTLDIRATFGFPAVCSEIIYNVIFEWFLTSQSFIHPLGPWLASQNRISEKVTYSYFSILMGFVWVRVWHLTLVPATLLQQAGFWWKGDCFQTWGIECTLCTLLWCEDWEGRRFGGLFLSQLTVGDISKKHVH